MFLLVKHNQTNLVLAHLQYFSCTRTLLHFAHPTSLLHDSARRAEIPFPGERALDYAIMLACTITWALTCIIVRIARGAPKLVRRTPSGAVVLAASTECAPAIPRPDSMARICQHCHFAGIWPCSPTKRSVPISPVVKVFKQRPPASFFFPLVSHYYFLSSQYSQVPPTFSC